jgi:hypothetical protein
MKALLLISFLVALHAAGLAASPPAKAAPQLLSKGPIRAGANQTQAERPQAVPKGRGVRSTKGYLCTGVVNGQTWDGEDHFIRTIIVRGKTAQARLNACCTACIKRRNMCHRCRDNCHYFSFWNGNKCDLFTSRPSSIVRWRHGVRGQLVYWN